jgi:AraC-like DNA-binding protein
LSPRDVLILDSDYPLTVDQGAPHHVAINVGVSEAWLRQWLPDPHVLAMRRIPGGSLWSQALSSYLCELTPEFASAPPLPLSLIADQVGSLLALTASGMHGATVANTAAVRSLFEQILDCLTQRCAEPQLTAAEVAASLNISVRTLHRTFAAAHQTFGEKLIEARARVALRMLMSPLFNRVTTGEIGKRAGFLNPSHFAKVMRVRTGRTPLQLRNAAHTDAVERDVSSERA